MDSNTSLLLPLDYHAEDGIKEFLTDFFRVSDDPQGDAKWLEFFRENATFVLFGNTAKGLGDIFPPITEIKPLRKQMWEHTSARKHTVHKAIPARFPCPKGEDCLDLSMFGTLDMEMKNGDKVSCEWAGHARLKREHKDSGRWQFAEYRVYK